MKKLILLSALIALASCDGPWNTLPEDPVVPDPQLRMSLFVVGGRPFDTLWLDRTQPLGLKYDSTRSFVQSATVGVYESSGRLAMSYHLATPSAVAWVPDSQVLVRAGRTYVAKAHVVWNGDPNWPASSTAKNTDLEAQTTVPATWSVEQTAPAPVEMLIPSLAAGGEVGEGRGILDSLDLRFPGWSSRWNMTDAMLDSLRQGLPVFRTIRSGDSLWYISDDRHKVLNFDGKTVSRAYRQILLRQHPGAGFAGAFAVERFDPSADRIVDPITETFRSTLGMTDWSTDDSASMFQPGETRYAFGPYPGYAPDIYGWPELNPFSNIAFGYTGLNTLYFYSVDSQYIVYQSQLSRQAGGDKTALPYTNVKGGTGYFAAALVDSFQVRIVAEGCKTFPVQALRATACRKSREKARKDGETFVPGPVCSDLYPN